MPSRQGAPQAEVRDVPYQAREKSDQSPRKRVMVLPFLDGSGRSDKAAVVARESFGRALRKTDEFVIVSNTDFPKDIATYLKNGEYDLETMAKIGAGMGLAGIIEGKIIEVKAKRVGDEVGLVRQVRARIDATVQIDPLIRQAGAKDDNWAYIPGFAGRRLAYGLPISMVPIAKYEQASAEVQKLFEEPPLAAYERARKAAVNYILVGPPGRAAHPGVDERFNTIPNQLPLVFKNTSISIYAVN
mgnify:CR=1 FL=1